ncbi:hypothetical protein Tco_0366880 [Tanacetum coccineum]
MVAYLEKTKGSEGFHQIIDFLTASHIQYALTKSPTIYASFIEQFWQTATLSTIEDGVMEITATIDGRVKTITEASIRKHLKLKDYDGISTLPTVEIFEQLALMRYVTTSDSLTFQKGHFSPQWKFLIHTILHCLSPKKIAWEQFSSNIATAIICLATNRTFNFSNLIFKAMVLAIFESMPLRTGPDWLFDIDALTRTMNYEPIVADDSIFNFTRDDEDDGVVADMNNLDTTIQVSPNLTTRIHKDHPFDQVIKDLQSATQTRKMSKNLEEHGFEETQKVNHAVEDQAGYRLAGRCLQFKLQEVWTLVDLPNGKTAIGSKWIISMETLTFFWDRQVKQRRWHIYLVKINNVAKDLRKFGFTEVKTTSTPMETQKPAASKIRWVKKVDVPMYYMVR